MDNAYICGQVWCQWGLYQAATLGPCQEAGWLEWLGGLVTCHPALLLLSCAMAANQLYTLLQLSHQLRQVQGTSRYVYEPNAVCWPIIPTKCHFS